MVCQIIFFELSHSLTVLCLHCLPHSYTKLRIKYYYIRLDLCSLRSMAAFHTKVILMSYTQFSIRCEIKKSHWCNLYNSIKIYLRNRGFRTIIYLYNNYKYGYNNYVIISNEIKKEVNIYV